jgi:hypothetical protein
LLFRLLVVLLCKLANLSFFILGTPNSNLRVLLAMIPLTAILLNFLGQILYFTTVDSADILSLVIPLDIATLLL